MISDTYNCTACSEFCCEQTAKQVDFIASCEGDNKIAFLDACLGENLARSSVTVHGDYVKIIYNRIKNFFIGVDNGYVVMLICKLICNSKTDLADSDNNNFNSISTFHRIV